MRFHLQMTRKKPTILNQGYVHRQRKNATTMNNIVNHLKEAELKDSNQKCCACMKNRGNPSFQKRTDTKISFQACNQGYVHKLRKVAMTMNNIVNHLNKEADRLEKCCWACVKNRCASRITLDNSKN